MEDTTCKKHRVNGRIILKRTLNKQTASVSTEFKWNLLLGVTTPMMMMMMMMMIIIYRLVNEKRKYNTYLQASCSYLCHYNYHGAESLRS
jgi:hypothetical protein